MKTAIDFLAFVTTGRWPVIAPSSSTALSSSFGLDTASPRPMLMVILVSRGASIELARLNSVISFFLISAS